MYILKSLRAKYKTSPWFTVPYIDNSSKALTGQHDMSKQELSKQPYLIEATTQYPLSHNESLDEKIPEQKLKLEMIKHLPEVAPSQSKADPVKHLFFLYNAEEVADEVVSSYEKKSKAMKVVEDNSSNAGFRDLGFFLGIDPRRHVTKVLKKMVYQEADNNPERVLAFTDKGSAKYLFVRKIVKTGIVRHSNNGYYFGEVLLGYGESEVVAYIENEKNTEIKERLGALLREEE
jgi:hypothetical protein